MMVNYVELILERRGLQRDLLFSAAAFLFI